MGPTWGQQDPGGPHVGPMNLAIWVVMMSILPTMDVPKAVFMTTSGTTIDEKVGMKPWFSVYKNWLSSTLDGNTYNYYSIYIW